MITALQPRIFAARGVCRRPSSASWWRMGIFTWRRSVIILQSSTTEASGLLSVSTPQPQPRPSMTAELETSSAVVSTTAFYQVAPTNSGGMTQPVAALPLPQSGIIPRDRAANQQLPAMPASYSIDAPDAAPTASIGRKSFKTKAEVDAHIDEYVKTVDEPTAAFIRKLRRTQMEARRCAEQRRLDREKDSMGVK